MEAFLLEKGLNSNTAKTYTYFYKKIVEKVFNKIEPEDMVSDETVDKILEYITKSDLTTGSKTAYIRAWRGISIRKHPNKDNKKLYDYVKTSNRELDYAPASEKEISNKITMSFIVTKREEYKDKLKAKFHTNDMYYLLCCFYTYLPPLRSQDYYNTVIKTEDTDTEKENYYDIESKQLVLNEYKTGKSYGKRVIDFPEDLAKAVETFHNKSNSKYLICTRTGGKLDANSFKKALNSCIQKHVSSSMIRKCFISDKIDVGISAEDRKKTAKIMGHSLNTQQSIYSKFSDVLHPQDDDMNYLMRRHEQLITQLKENTNKMFALIEKEHNN